MSHYTKEDIYRLVEEEDVEFIRLQFTDMYGNLKNIAVTASQLERALNNKFTFDGSAIDDYIRIEESDMCLYPDYDTFAIFPWRPQQGKVARMLCNVHRINKEPFVGDPRYILQKEIAKAKEQGYTFEVGPKCEFFLFDTDENTMPTTATNEQAGYFDIGPLDFGENARRDMVMTLEDMGFIVEASHHEIEPAQHEIDFAKDEALRTADNIMTFRLAVRTIAKRHGLHATFMPKPKSDVNGSGMHLQMRLKDKNGKSVFEDKKDELGLSKEAYYFIGGLLKHMRAMAAVTNPLVNSYKRLVPGFGAPAYIAWSTTNRSPLIRICNDSDEGICIELRSPDSAANPYLTLAVCLSAGLDGIKNKIKPPKCVNANLFAMTEEERKANKVVDFPVNLWEALLEMEKDSVVMDTLGEHISQYYVTAKKEEWSRYRAQVSQWEINEYLNKY